MKKISCLLISLLLLVGSCFSNAWKQTNVWNDKSLCRVFMFDTEEDFEEYFDWMCEDRCIKEDKDLIYKWLKSDLDYCLVEDLNKENDLYKDLQTYFTVIVFRDSGDRDYPLEIRKYMLIGDDVYLLGSCWNIK